MATLRNKGKLAAVSRETPESTRNNQSQNTLNPGMPEKYITQVSEEIERRVAKKLSQEFSRTDSRILGALSKLNEFLLNTQVRRFRIFQEVKRWVANKSEEIVLRRARKALSTSCSFPN